MARAPGTANWPATPRRPWAQCQRFVHHQRTACHLLRRHLGLGFVQQDLAALEQAGAQIRQVSTVLAART
jgi:hypothetical protein